MSPLVGRRRHVHRSRGAAPPVRHRMVDFVTDACNRGDDAVEPQQNLRELLVVETRLPHGDKACNKRSQRLRRGEARPLAERGRADVGRAPTSWAASRSMSCTPSVSRTDRASRQHVVHGKALSAGTRHFQRLLRSGASMPAVFAGCRLAVHIDRARVYVHEPHLANAHARVVRDLDGSVGTRSWCPQPRSGGAHQPPGDATGRRNQTGAREGRCPDKTPFRRPARGDLYADNRA
jgi:hypothetical protein